MKGKVARMGTTELTIADLKRVLRQVAGVDESVDLDSDIMDVDFGDLGYDSLALLETAAQIERECGVVMTDDAVVASDTPRALLALVNGLFAELV
jgi:act minimal PKS acyl carrier protein